MVMLTACREKEKGLLCRCWWCSVVCDTQTYPFYLLVPDLTLFYKRNLTGPPVINRAVFFVVVKLNGLSIRVMVTALFTGILHRMERV
jgi:hypothetical protein